LVGLTASFIFCLGLLCLSLHADRVTEAGNEKGQMRLIIAHYCLKSFFLAFVWLGFIGRKNTQQNAQQLGPKAKQ